MSRLGPFDQVAAQLWGGFWPGMLDLQDEISTRAVDRTREEMAKIGKLTLARFIAMAWHAVEPARPYVHGWHIDAISDHLEAIFSGELIRLLITLPPGMMKSLLTSVFMMAYEWGPRGAPSMRYIGFSYDTTLSTRDSLRCRRLLQSSWYQQLWGDRFRLVDDQNVKTRYENDQTGFRISDYVGGGTGDRADRLIIDDPHQVADVESEPMRKRALLWLHETLPTRLNDPERTAIVVIHHRIHEQDMAGEILASNMGYEHLCLPMEFDPQRRCSTKIGFKDPRKKAGELLFPERFPQEVVDRDKNAMGQYAWAGQMQQEPAPRGGGKFKRHWFEIVAAPPSDCRWVRRWDLAGTKDAGSYTAGVLMGFSKTEKKFYIADVVRAQIEGDEVKRLIKQTAALDVVRFGRSVYSIWLPQDPGQAGKVQAKDHVTMLVGYDAHTELESGDKEIRSRPFAAQCEAGNVKLIEGSWIRAYLDELAMFPTGKFNDQVDASSGAFGALILNPKRGIIIGSAKGHY